MVFGTDQTGRYFCYTTQNNILKCLKIKNPKRFEIFFNKNKSKNLINSFSIKSWRIFETNVFSFVQEILFFFLLYEFKKIEIYTLNQNKRIKLKFVDKIISGSNFKNILYTCSHFFIYVFDLISGEILKIFHLSNLPNKKKFKKIKITNNGHFLITIDNFFSIINVKTGKILKKVKNLKSIFKSLGFFSKEKLILGNKKNFLEILEINKKNFIRLDHELFGSAKILNKNFMIRNSKYFKIFFYQKFGLNMLSFKIYEQSEIKKNHFASILFSKRIKRFDILAKNKSLIIFCEKKKNISNFSKLHLFIKKKNINKMDQQVQIKKKNTKIILKLKTRKKKKTIYHRIFKKKNFIKTQSHNKINLFFKLKKKDEFWNKKKYVNYFFLFKSFNQHKSSEKITSQIKLLSEIDIFQYLLSLDTSDVQNFFFFLTKKIFLKKKNFFFLFIWIKELFFCNFLLFSKNKSFRDSFSTFLKKICKNEDDNVFSYYSIRLSFILVQILNFVRS
ncbi:hypothetical protein CMESO_156 (nucleomorph) [Chroomonas mesostigmatica CCMP1168]|uniref:Uncharacterized protein n=1 Tax=Chroomonas mesostigmatica CCMP1168 TaxID=1195612 RepID=J7G7Q9_9CRYP|nr:hypothetical protein CMESO_156 [Chroomonas mesostigmatica CCMP1168]